MAKETVYTVAKISSFQRRGNALETLRKIKLRPISSIFRFNLSPRKDGWWVLTEYRPITDNEEWELTLEGREKVFGKAETINWE